MPLRRRKSATPPADRPGGEAAVDRPTQLGAARWKDALRGTGKEIFDDELIDRAAGLTYYAVLSIFPALLVLFSLLGVAGKKASEEVLESVENLAPGAVRSILSGAVTQLEGTTGGGVLALVGLVIALWTASRYVSAFIRTANAVYDIPEGRPLWKIMPLRLGLTVMLMTLLAISAVIVVFTGSVARNVSRQIGLGDAGLTAWSVAKWPVLLLLVVAMIALLYGVAPNVSGRGVRWLTPGSLVAVAVWLAASAGFALYVGNFGSYNQTYGTLAGVIIFLVWLWLTNLALLVGLEFDAELSRQRAVSGGHPADREPYVEPRETTTW